MSGLVICTLEGGKTILDLEAKGLKFKIADDLKEELSKDRPQNRSRGGEIAFYQGLFLKGSGNKALADQEEDAHLDALKLRGKLRLKRITEEIRGFADYGEIFLQYKKRGAILLERGFHPVFLSARTRTRVFPENVGPQNYVVDIGPYDPDGLCVHILSRDEKDPEVGVWPLFRPV